jgi:hypothetical protein
LAVSTLTSASASLVVEFVVDAVGVDRRLGIAGCLAVEGETGEVVDVVAGGLFGLPPPIPEDAATTIVVGPAAVSVRPDDEQSEVDQVVAAGAVPGQIFQVRGATVGPVDPMMDL